MRSTKSNPARLLASNQAGTTGQTVGRQMTGHAGMHADHAAADRFMKIMDNIAQQTHQSLTCELSQKEGVPFDRCYLSSQVFNHTWMVDALTVFERNASSGLQPVLQEGLQTAQQHLRTPRLCWRGSSRVKQNRPRTGN